MGYPIGSHPGRDGLAVENGSKIEPLGPREGDYRNFLESSAVREAVGHRCDPATKASEPGQQFKEDRLRYDLLSSMPMCFNLFGELHNNQDRLSAAGQRLFGTTGPGRSVKFEHSPGRQNPSFSNDGTAFDVALYFGGDGEPATIIGIETKYHEHAIAEAAPDASKPGRKAASPDRLKMPRYREITERAQAGGIFKQGWESLLGSELQQIWRDHILLLAMLQHESKRWAGGKYVLVHPAKNPSFAEAGDRYRSEFLENDDTFAVMTVEDLLDADVLHSAASGQQFRDRYLW
jgi:hypothetical protein